jgi:MYXO-CTERM domain-containing protein
MKAFIFFVAAVGYCIASRGSSAPITYEVTFNATWTSQSHPGAYPAGAHFSALIGGVHSPAVAFWTPGGQASAGIEQMAEVGGTSALRGEVQAAINAGNALAVLQGSGIASPGTTSLTFDVTPEFPLVTLTAMVAPTPDWFIGVHGFDLRDGGGWKQHAVVDLYAYDAGTEEGVGFSLSNPATAPQQPIALLALPLSPTAPPLGTFTFTRVSAAPEPTSAALAAGGLGSLVARRRRRSRLVMQA